jgi:hypothetical protein
VKPRGGSAGLSGLFKKRRLGPGTVIEVQVTAADGTGVLFRFVTKPNGKRPKSSMLCIAPGSSRPKSCS